MARKKDTSKFKTRVVSEALKEYSPVSEPAQKYELAPQQISLWKRVFLTNAETLFEKKPMSKKSQADEEKEELLKAICRAADAVRIYDGNGRLPAAYGQVEKGKPGSYSAGVYVAEVRTGIKTSRYAIVR